MGLKDTVTPITFVALGTSLPDLFASRQDTIQEKYADNSIGNVTGSNSVNVFIGDRFYLLEYEGCLFLGIFLYALLSVYHKLKFDSLFITHFVTVCDRRSSGGNEAKWIGKAETIGTKKWSWSPVSRRSMQSYTVTDSRLRKRKHLIALGRDLNFCILGTPQQEAAKGPWFFPSLRNNLLVFVLHFRATESTHPHAGSLGVSMLVYNLYYILQEKPNWCPSVPPSLAVQAARWSCTVRATSERMSWCHHPASGALPANVGQRP